MRSIAFLVALLVGCSKPNPEVCCVTDEQCAFVGFDEPQPCDVGQACIDYSCAAAQCTTSNDCADPALPICSHGVCVANTGCSVDDDCADVPGLPRCAPDGACVACISDDQCPAEAALCDPDTRACRGCEADDECDSGICIEATGLCAEASRALYLTQFGVDAGECTEAAPCATFEYVMPKVSPARDVIRILGGSFGVDNPVTIDYRIVIDGTNTTIGRPVAGPTFTVTSSDRTIIEGVELRGRSGATEVVVVAARSNLLIAHARLGAATASTMGGTLELRDAELMMSTARCTGGTATLTRSTVTDGGLSTENCALRVAQNRFSSLGDGMLRAVGGSVLVENNQFVQAYELADSVVINGVAAGSAFRFNTVINSSAITSSGSALHCDSVLTVDSNVFAYNSTNPIGFEGPGCAATNSVFDLPGAPDADPAAGNIAADMATLFVDSAAGDFAPAPESPARGLGTPGNVFEDLRGMKRPMPAGTDPDAGAYEAP